MRSEGSRLLGATAEDHETIAATIGVARSAVTHWLSGFRRPGRGRRLLLLEHYGIPEAAWDEMPTQKDLPRRRVPRRTTTDMTAEARAREQLRRLDALRSELVETGNMTPQYEIRLFNQETKINAQLSKITGEGHEITEARILKTAAWRRIMETMVEALRDSPEAAARVAEALKGIEQ